jgi:hypothetical protein
MPTYGEGLLVQERTVSCTVRGIILSGLTGFMPKGGANEVFNAVQHVMSNYYILDHAD